MADELTPQQLQAVTEQGGELLVSAAAGSGKTKVLVDRLMRQLNDPVDPANIDEFLIITFTKAAAAELRGRIAAKLTEQIAQQPENRHLQQQLQRLYLTNISTVHAFCGELLRQYAYILDLPADFRVAEEGECVQLQSRVMEQLLEEAYTQQADGSDFYALIDSQGFGRDDSRILDVILKVYNSARCHLDPDTWLDRCEKAVDTDTVSDISDTDWGDYLIRDLHRHLDLQIDAMQKCADLAKRAEEMAKPAALLRDTVEQLKMLRQCDTWDAIYMNREIDYGRLTFSKKCTDLLLVEKIKAVREFCKKSVSKKLRNFAQSSDDALADIRDSAAATTALIRLVRDFSNAYKKQKMYRHILDFGDLEHLTLDLLLGKDRLHRTRLADEIGLRFREVMVDEYQDANAVQDAIYRALTEKRHNCFMVGDVKQSIYQFRLADPGIFLDKYNRFVPAVEAVPGQGRKVLMTNNFRSAGSVIEAVNAVFSANMSPQVGGLDYGEDERLYEGIAHAAANEPEIELYGIAADGDTYAQEAEFVADRIAQLLDGSHTVRHKDGFRPIEPGDIAILLRAPATSGPALMDALTHRGIRCAMGGASDILCAEEIQTLCSLLQVIHNPLQDIPLLAVLSSKLFCFTADDLASFRAQNKTGCLYEALQTYDSPKAQYFLDTLLRLRQEARRSRVSVLLGKIFTLTRIDSIYSAMEDGLQKIENLQCFCQLVDAYESAGSGGLGPFLEHLQMLQQRGGVLCADGTGGDAVSIMSIHKSKGLEFPVVFLCGLSRAFNTDNSRAQILCDKTLGLGLSCVDSRNRVRYPTVARRAIAEKTAADDLSEEMRVLYVAMTRAKDRLIMTYASNTLSGDIEGMCLRMDLCDSQLLTRSADCPGDWVLLTALRRREATAFFQLSTPPNCVGVCSSPWMICVVYPETDTSDSDVECKCAHTDISDALVAKIRRRLAFRYPFSAATQTPSKQTATQLKGREKDAEIAENADITYTGPYNWRTPVFSDSKVTHASGADHGLAMHTLMQHIDYAACTTLTGVNGEICRLRDAGFLTLEQQNMIRGDQICALFASPTGKRMQMCTQVLREFKFSVLEHADRYMDGPEDERILLQGVVDCALIEDDGITVIDFKTDRITEDMLAVQTEKYRMQVSVYADALQRIFEMPVKEKRIYFFAIDRWVTL